MNNKDKSRELSKKFARQYHANNWPEWSDDESFHFSNEEIYNACLEMAAWKEQQMIEKACNWIKENKHKYIKLHSMKLMVDDSIIEDFKKYMEEN